MSRYSFQPSGSCFQTTMYLPSSIVAPFVPTNVNCPASHAVSPFPSTSTVRSSIRPTGMARNPFHMSWIAARPETGATPGGKARASVV